MLDVPIIAKDRFGAGSRNTTTIVSMWETTHQKTEEFWQL